MLNLQPQLAQIILAAKSPKHAKRLSKRIRCTLDWDSQPLAEKIMEEILIDKFTQVQKCNDFLRETHQKKLKLVEAVPTSDTIWGSGLGKFETLNTEMKCWPGENKLGTLLERVRSHLFDEGWSESDSEEMPTPLFPNQDQLRILAIG